MHYHLSTIPALLRTPAGRIQLAAGLHYRIWPVLSRLAALHRQILTRGTRIVAVVGSLGKSTTTRAVATALGAPLRHDFSYNCFSGVAQAVLRIRPGQSHAVIEVGINKRGQMASYAHVVRPNLVVVTSIGSEHHSSLGSLEVTRHEKADMVRALAENGVAVLNGDDPNVLWMRSQTRARIVTFGFGDANEVRANNVRLDWPHGTRFTLHAGNESYEMTVRLLGRHMIYPILAAVAAARAEGLPLDQTLALLQELPPTPGRLEPLALPNNIWILRDDTKSSHETLYAALDVLAQIPASRRLVALGEISEPLGASGPSYRAIGERLAGIVSCAVIIGTRRSFRAYAGGAVDGGLARSALIYGGHSILTATDLLREQLRPGDVLLIKGRYEQHLCRISLLLMGRVVRCDIDCCRIKKTNCSACPMLERGWQHQPPIT